MKKIIFSAATFLFVNSLTAQVTAIHDARDLLSRKDYLKAISLLDVAVTKEETKNNAEAWFLRGLAYQFQATDSSVTPPPAASSLAYISLMKALSINPAYTSDINSALISNAMSDFNEGVTAYSTDPTDAYDKFMRVVNIYNSGDGKRFVTDRDFTTLLNSAKTNAAYSAMAAKKDADALLLLNELRASAVKDSNIYRYIADIYERQNNNQQELAVIKEARTFFPDNETFRNLEINWYMNNGTSADLMTKLEEARKKDPDNADLLFNLGNAYEKAAFPKTTKGEILPGPANFDRLFSEAEAAYDRAVKLSPDNADYHYNYGVLYYTNAAELISQMNKITGTTEQDNKLYDHLKVLRDESFMRALSSFEKVYALLGPAAANLDEAKKTTYKNTLTGLYGIYKQQGKNDKADEIKLKLEKL